MLTGMTERDWSIALKVFDAAQSSRGDRAVALARDITPVIPRRENSKQRRRFFPKHLYRLRARIEQTIGKLKRFKRQTLATQPSSVLLVG